MTNERHDYLLERVANDIEELKVLLLSPVPELKKPQHPKPGTVVEWNWKGETKKRIGTVEAMGRGVEGMYRGEVAL